MIKVENLVKIFGEVAAVDDVSFDVAAGEIFGHAISHRHAGRMRGAVGRAAVAAAVSGCFPAPGRIAVSLRPFDLFRLDVFESDAIH